MVGINMQPSYIVVQHGVDCPVIQEAPMVSMQWLELSVKVT